MQVNHDFRAASTADIWRLDVQLAARQGHAV